MPLAMPRPPLAFRLLALSLLLLPLAACFGGKEKSGSTPFQIHVAVSPGALSIPAGGGGYATVTVSRPLGYQGPISLALENAPAGVVASGTVPPGALTGRLDLRVAQELGPQNLDTLRVKGTAGALVGSAPFRLVVAAPLPSGQIRSDLVQASGGLQKAGLMENTALALEPLPASVSKGASDTTEARQGFHPSATPQ